MDMKKGILPILIILAAFLLCACSQSGPASAPAATEETPAPTPEPTPSPAELYETALQTLYACDFEGAKTRFEALGDYEDSLLLTDYCDYRIEKAGEELTVKYIKEGCIVKDFTYGTYYISDLAYIYVPHEMSPETGCILYYAGGGGEESVLELYSMPYIWAYFPEHDPDAVIVQFKRSGYSSMTKTNLRAIDMLRQLELELNFVIHDMVVIGSSSGGYTANRAAVQLWTEGNIRVKKLLDMDNGMEWEALNRKDNLSEEELDDLAAEGTEVYLFEQPGVGMDKKPIADMVNHGVNVTIVECKNDDHNTITVNMYKKDIFGWALDEYEELDSEEYTLVKLEK